MKDLYHEEQKTLDAYIKKLERKSLTLEDAQGIGHEYRELLNQSRVTTKISDRLQKRLDGANQKIKIHNLQIKSKNIELEDTISQLDKMTVGKKATRIMFLMFVLLFVSEQVFLEPIIEEMINARYVSVGIMLIIAVLLKLLETKLEQRFIKEKKKKIIKSEQPNILKTNRK